MAEIDVVKIGLTDLKSTIDGLNASLTDNTAKLATTKVELADYNSKIKEAEKELKTLQASTEADNATIEAQKAKIIELNQQREMAKIAIKEQTKAVNENISMIQAGNTARDAEAGSMAQMKANLKLVNFEINNMSANERDASEAGATLKAQSLELTNALKAQESALGNNTRNVGNYPKVVDLATASLSDLKTELMILKKTSFMDKAPEEIQAIKQRMGDLTDTMGDLKAEMAMMGGPGIGAIVSGLKGVAASTEGVIASLDLLGVDSKVLNGLTEKMTSLIAVTQSLSEIEDLVNSGKAKAIALKLKDMAVTASLTVAKWAEVVATNAVSAAQWLLNIAMEANPIGLVVLAVVALIAAFWALYKATGSVVEALMWMVNPLGMVVKLLYDNYVAEQENNAEKEKAIALAKADVEAQEKRVEAQKKVVASLEKELETMKARGATEEQQFKMSQRIHDEKIKLANEEAALAEKNFKLAIAQGGLLLDSATKYIEAKNKANAEQKAKEKEIEDKANAEEKKRVEDARKAQEDAIKKVADAKKKAREDALKYEAQIKDITIALIKDAKQKELETLELAHQRELDAINKQAKNANAIKKALDQQYLAEKAQIEENYNKASNQKAIDAEIQRQNLKISALQNSSQAWMDAQMVVLLNQRNKELEQEGLTEQEKANIKESYRQQANAKLDEFQNAQFQSELTFVEQNGQLKGLKEEEIQAQMLAIKQRYLEEGKLTEQQEFDYKMELKTREVEREQAVKDAKSDITKQAVSTAIGLLGVFDKSGKAAAIAQVAYDNGMALVSLVKASMANPLNPVTFGAAGIAQFAMGSTMIALNVKKALAQINAKKADTGTPSAGSAGGGGGSVASTATAVSQEFYKKYGQDQGTANNNLAGSNQAVQNNAIANALSKVSLNVAVTDIQHGLNNAKVRDSRISS
jgi:hypothetical protein